MKNAREKVVKMIRGRWKNKREMSISNGVRTIPCDLSIKTIECIELTGKFRN